MVFLCSSVQTQMVLWWHISLSCGRAVHCVVPTCFGSHRDHHQGAVLCLAKTTGMVFLCSSVQTQTMLWWHISLLCRCAVHCSALHAYMTSWYATITSSALSPRVQFPSLGVPFGVRPRARTIRDFCQQSFGPSDTAEGPPGGEGRCSTCTYDTQMSLTRCISIYSKLSSKTKAAKKQQATMKAWCKIRAATAV